MLVADEIIQVSLLVVWLSRLSIWRWLINTTFPMDSFSPRWIYLCQCSRGASHMDAVLARHPCPAANLWISCPIHGPLQAMRHCPFLPVCFKLVQLAPLSSLTHYFWPMHHRHWQLPHSVGWPRSPNNLLAYPLPHSHLSQVFAPILLLLLFFRFQVD